LASNKTYLQTLLIIAVYYPASMHAQSLIISGNDRMLLHYVTKKLEANAVSYSIFPAVSDSAHMAQIKDDKLLALVSNTATEILAGNSDYRFCSS
jgi:hypothetical protein